MIEMNQSLKAVTKWMEAHVRRHEHLEDTLENMRKRLRAIEEDE